MASTNFVTRQTVISADWCNEVNDLVFDGTIPTTSSWYPSAANQLIYSTAAGAIDTLTTANSSVLVTNGSGSISWSTSLPAAVLNLSISGNGLISNSAGTLTGRTLTAASTKITITNGDGVSANPTIDVNQANLDHGSIGGLSDDDHTQYALLVGRSGGQTIIGGTGAGDDLTLQTTSNASKGTYFLSELTSNGFVKTSGGNGALTVDTSSYQVSDSTLTALAAYNTNGLLTQTAADTFTGRTLTGTSNEITVTNGDGVSGNPTLSIPSTIDLSGKTYLKIPTGTAPTVDQSGKIAIDTNTDNTNITHGSVVFHDGTSLRYIPSISTLPSTNNHVLKYNSVSKAFDFGAVTASSASDVFEITGTASNAGRLRLYEDTDNGTNYVELIGASSVAANRTVTYPDTDISCFVVQRVSTQTGAVATGTTTIPEDDTIPQNTEGDQYMSLSITPKNTNNILVIDVVFNGTNSGNFSNIIVALFQDTTANALAAVQHTMTDGGSGGIMGMVSFRHTMTAGTTSATTLKIRAGSNQAGTTTFNGASGSRRYGGVMASSITITEYSS